MKEAQNIRTRVPDVLLNGQPYIIDVDARAFTSHHDEKTSFSFDKLTNDGEYSTLVVPRENKSHVVNDRYVEYLVVHIPNELLQQQKSLDELAAKYNTAAQEHNWGIYIVDEPLGRRLAGELPHINIAGTDFTVDWRLKELRESVAPWNNLKIDQMYLSENGESYLCYYNQKSHTLFLPEVGMTKIPDEVIWLGVPNELHLDPVGVARQYGMKDHELLAEFPIKNDLKADVKPVMDSPLQELVRRNTQASQNQAQNKGFKKNRRIR